MTIETLFYMLTIADWRVSKEFKFKFKFKVHMPSVMEDEHKHIKTTTDPARGMAWDHNVGTYKIQSQHDHNVHIIRMNG